MGMQWLPAAFSYPCLTWQFCDDTCRSLCVHLLSLLQCLHFAEPKQGPRYGGDHDLKYRMVVHGGLSGFNDDQRDS